MRDVQVIGGGIIGLLTARELRLSGAEVTLIEMGETGREPILDPAPYALNASR